MTGSVQGYLERCQEFLEALAKRPDVVAITGFSGDQVLHFSREGIGKALQRYRKEAARKTAKNHERERRFSV